MLARKTWNNVSFYLLTVENHLTDTLAYSVRILDGDFINTATESAPYSVFLPL